MRKEGVEFAWAIESCLASLGLLVHFVDDEAGQNGVDCQTVHCHEERSYCEGDDEDDLRIRENVRGASRVAR